jgi:F0F1-type ATP synthase membrane subunit b/b'
MDWQAFLLGFAAFPLVAMAVVMLSAGDTEFIVRGFDKAHDEKLKDYVADAERYKTQADTYLKTAERYLADAQHLHEVHDAVVERDEGVKLLN